MWRGDFEKRINLKTKFNKSFTFMMLKIHPPIGCEFGQNRLCGRDLRVGYRT